MTTEIKNQEYFVASIQCAAWLILADFKFLRIQQKNKNKNYYFENSPELQEYISLFRNGEYFSPKFAEIISQLKIIQPEMG